MIDTKTSKGDPVYISVPTQKVQTMPQAMDLIVFEGCEEKVLNDGRIFLNAKGVRTVMPWHEVVVTKKSMFSSELVPMPLPEKEEKSNAFLIYSGAPNAPESFATMPGFHRIVEWNNNVTTARRKGESERRLSVNFYQRQWSSEAELRIDLEPFTMTMILWSDQCNQMLLDGGSLSQESWTAIAKANPIPFYAAVCVDGTYTKGTQSISLPTLSVQWDLRSYLESSSCLELKVSKVKKLIPDKSSSSTSRRSSGDEKKEIINMSATGHVPTGQGWRYYAMTANGAKTVDQLADPMVLFAVLTTAVESVVKEQASESCLESSSASVEALPSKNKRQKTKGKSGKKIKKKKKIFFKKKINR
jgi:hypothetical protein